MLRLLCHKTNNSLLTDKYPESNKFFSYHKHMQAHKNRFKNETDINIMMTVYGSKTTALFYHGSGIAAKVV